MRGVTGRAFVTTCLALGVLSAGCAPGRSGERVETPPPLEIEHYDSVEEAIQRPEPEPPEPVRPRETWALAPEVRSRTVVGCKSVPARACEDARFSDRYRGQRPPPRLDPARFGTARDHAAAGKIVEALEIWEMASQERLALLLGTSEACQRHCSPATQARIWMYVGIVVGALDQDLEGAACAFQTALRWDPHVRLDAEVATEPVKAAFEHERCAVRAR